MSSWVLGTEVLPVTIGYRHPGSDSQSETRLVQYTSVHESKVSVGTPIQDILESHASESLWFTDRVPVCRPTPLGTKSASR